MKKNIFCLLDFQHFIPKLDMIFSPPHSEVKNNNNQIMGIFIIIEVIHLWQVTYSMSTAFDTIVIFCSII